MNSIFITGATGLLGTSFLGQIKSADFDTITLLCRSSVTLPDSLAHADNVKVIYAPLSDTERYSSALHPQTRIVHMAAITGKASPDEYFDVNIEGTRLLIEAAKKQDVKDFVFISSIAVSFSDRDGYLYADSKEQAEKIVLESGLNYCIFRPTIILGKDASIWHSFVKLAKSSLIVLPGNGQVKIQPIYIEDMVRLILDVISAGRINHELLEVGGPETLSMDEFMQRIHFYMTKSQPRIIHLPIGILVWSLRLLEKVFPLLLPVSSGQFSSFFNEGTAKNNSLLKSHFKRMKDIDAMFELLLNKEEGADTQKIIDECDIFTRYLMGASPDQYICNKYIEAFLPDQALGKDIEKTKSSSFDKLLLKLATIHPVCTRAIDIYSRFFYADSNLRKRLVLLLAILESYSSSYNKLDSLQPNGNVFFASISLVCHSLFSAFLLIVVTPLLLPLQMVLHKKAHL